MPKHNYHVDGVEYYVSGSHYRFGINLVGGGKSLHTTTTSSLAPSSLLHTQLYMRTTS